MRQLLLQVPRGKGALVVERARAHEGANLHRVEAEGPEGPLDVVTAHVPNREVEPLLAELQERVPELRVTLLPQGVMALWPPAGEAPSQVTDVQPRSAIEVFLAGLQAVGSWKGFLGYAAAAGVIVWIGLLTSTIYLLVAAMLVAPFAGPAMNLAIGTARGDRVLLARSAWRYFASIAVAIVVSALLTLAIPQRTPTALMIEASKVSLVALLLPLTAGAAGALNLVESERNSLVSGAAVGMLIAASLAPAAGILGMAVVMGEWGMARSSSFLLLLQLAGINLGGALVFRAFGMRSKGARYARGRRWAVGVALAASLAMVGALVAWQTGSPPELQRSTLEHRALDDLHEAVGRSGLGKVVEAEVRYARAGAPGDVMLLATAHVRPAEGTDASDEEIERALETRIGRALSRGYAATPLVDVTVVRPPP